jgi:UDPglucose 6-dehydrogenase
VEQADLADLSGRHIAVLGLAFKAETDDLREAPAREVIGWLLDAGAVVHAHDPVAMPNAQASWRDWSAAQVSYHADAYAAAAGCDAVVVLTEWAAYRTLDLLRLRSVLGQPVLIDGRNLFDPRELARLGFHARGIGRPGDQPAAAAERKLTTSQASGAVVSKANAAGDERRVASNGHRAPHGQRAGEA